VSQADRLEPGAPEEFLERLVLVALPAVVAEVLVEHHNRAGDEPVTQVVDYLARLWCVINSYPLQRRPVRIAANLSMDTLKAVSREHLCLGRGDITLSNEALEELLPPAGLDANRCDSPQPVDLEARRVLDAGTSFGLIDDSAAALLQSVYVDGMTSTEAARRFRTAGHVLLSGAETLVERTDGIPKVGNRSEVPSPLSLDIGTDLATRAFSARAQSTTQPNIATSAIASAAIASWLRLSKARTRVTVVASAMT
jgi:hypothetical protein